jgi:large subunit ribosomal protein L30
MAKLRITQTKSSIDRPKRQKDTLQALGLRKISQSVEHEDTKQIQGMLNIVEHLVSIEKLS